MKPSIGDVVIFNFKAHNQIAAGPNSSKVLLFRQETNLLNVTRRKLLRSPDRNICGKGKSILNHKESRKGDHIDVQPAIKKKRGSGPQSPCKLKPRMSPRLLGMRMHLERSSLSSFPSPRTSLIGASQRDAPCTSSHIIPGLSLARLPRSSFVFCFRPLSSPLSSGLLCAISEAPHSIRNAAKEDERGGTRASRPQPPARDGG